MEPPPGGPPDSKPPQLIETRPESLATLEGFDEAAEFVFDEVISEGGGAAEGGRSGLSALVMLSPTVEEPKVDWKRSRITVEPREGWQPDRVYRVELLPGITDLRNNRSNEHRVITFTTGAPVPTTTLTGRVVDWSSNRPAANALVEALLVPDSLPYRALADSSGRFRLGPLPPGQYLVSGVIDQNRNQRADGREAFDTVRLARGKTEVGDLWAFEHDTTPPRANTVTLGDSVSATVELAQSLDPRLKLEPRNATVSALPDSTRVKVVSVLPKPLDDSLHAPKPAKPDSAAPDTTRKPPQAPVPRGARRPVRTEPSSQLTGRPPLSNQLVVRVGTPWKPGGRYAIEVRGVRNVSGTTGDVRGTLVVPERAARDTLKGATPADTSQDDKE
jgi:Carboxypeptidase regulatory-like domain/Bacterial Ig-like domain